MINGFEEYTNDLNVPEVKAMVIIAETISKKIGIENAVTNNEIIKGLKNNRDISLTPARVRKIINHIRLKKIVKRLVASKKGYYIENDNSKLAEYVEGLMHRSNSIKAVAESYDI